MSRQSLVEEEDYVEDNRSQRSASRVSVDYFDPTGVQELRTTLNRLSNSGEREKNSSGSDVTLSGDAPFDFEKTLKGFLAKADESEIQKRELSVMFKDLKVVGLGATASYQPTVGAMFNPKVALENFRNSRNPPVRDILSGFNGVVRPGEMLLVLGSPGSGCTTFLKTIANQRSEFYAVEGEVHYDSLSPQEIAKHYRGDLQYCPEDDVHFPTLTVEETIKFAAKTRTPHSRIVGESRDDYINGITDILLTVFGLRHARKTLVGDASIRGVSGGEKKRVSISEALAARSLINCWDNSTRGLDSATALEFSRALRIATDVAQLATVVSIYQAAESLYQVFDKVCVIYEGRMAYFGPADRARQYFWDMGYEPANRQTTPDFLVAVTDPNARIIRPGFESKVPRTAEDFAAYFNASLLAKMNNDDIEAYRHKFVGKPERATNYIASAHAEHATTSRKTSPYIVSIPMQTRAVMLRRIQILKGSLGAQITNVFAFLIQAIIVGTVFLRLENTTSAFFSRGGVLFFAILFAALSSMAEMPALFGQRSIVLRHQKAAFYYPFIDAAALTLVDIPITFVTMVAYCLALYWLVGLQASVGQFFIFFLLIITMTLVMKAWFRALAASFSEPAPAQAIAGVILLALNLYTGYNIPKPSMIKPLSWITYINPLRFGYEAILMNEFRTLNSTCSTLVPQGAGYENVTLQNQVCATLGGVPGQDWVDGSSYAYLSFEYKWSNMWMNFGIMVAFGVAFLAWLLIVTELNSKVAEVRSVILFKRGSKKAAPIAKVDEEKAGSPVTGVFQDAPEAAEEVLKEQPKMTDVFSWRNLDYTVPIAGGEKRRLLNDVSGYVVPGKLTALMGESGAGKTTLLNVLASRVDVGVVTGDRLVNGHALPADFQAQTGYCQQMDTHVATDTVREAVLFSAKLRQPQSVPLAEKVAYTQRCLVMCGLENYGDAIVGTLGVEHRKRLTIAVELAAKPKLLLFLDEPTSGLDSQSAWAIVSFLRSLANHGQAILCTIHQPSAELFQAFDRLLLLRKGGETVYFGDLGLNATTLINYFERNGSRQCLPEENPAEFMLDVIGAGATAKSTIDWHNEVWKTSPESAATQKEIEAIYAEGRSKPAVSTKLKTEFASPWGAQFNALLIRNFKNTWREPTYIMAKLGLNIAAGLFIGWTFWRSKNSMQGLQNKLFAIFMALIVSVPMAQQLQLPFINMRTIYEIRERPSRMYSWTALIASQFIVELPYNIFSSGMFFVCWYFAIDFPMSRAGYTYFVMGVLLPLYYTSIGQALAAMAATVEIAALLFTSMFSFVLIFNGVLQPFRLLGWWQWMYRLSPYTYLVEGLLGQALGRQELTCEDKEYVKIEPPAGETCGSYMNPYMSVSGGYITNPDATTSCNFCAFRTSDQFLGLQFNILYDNRWRDVGIFVAFIAFNVAATFAFTYLFRIKKFNFSRKKN